MKKEEIFFPDWERLLIGNTTWEFMAEVLLRTIIIFIALLIVLRMMGKRMNAQLTITELAVMVTLGGIASAPMQLPDRGILMVIVAFVCAFVFQRGLSWIAFRDRKVELATQGEVSLILKEGVLQIKEFELSRLSKDQIFAALRTHNIKHLGEVKRLYMEGYGMFSIIKASTPKPGLPIVPLKDEALLLSLPVDKDLAACTRCGYLADARQADNTECPNCSCDEWTVAAT
ncbi:DUF421 domain-containing protein [Rufibacter tibetensis]|uniref:YetF C-terminal domain-containing protein n=1 Tax=Rufibacter tibetensis TaxID=512763 RepID=A0A0P0CKN8_9BACT|nr:YetF domain-containing protein [Rufibacter tibetensis]ALJ00106.1 hypothetical protein DC20_15395 [Rufibacter tibetensis]